MSDTPDFGFGKFVPGFDFLQNLAKGAGKTMPNMPQLGNWVAPTLSVEDLDKRISELKTVQFWLDQNAVALKATIQALEVQKMTLATLKGMNFSMGDLANAFKIKTPEAAAPEAPKPTPAPTPAPQAESEAAAPTGVVDPMQWWGSLTQQFQHIAASAMKDAAAHNPMETTQNMAAGLAQEAIKTATDVATTMTRAAVDTVTTAAKTASRRKKAAADSAEAAAEASDKPAAKKASPAAKR